MNAENASWLRFSCKAILFLQFAGLAVGCFWFVKAVNNGFSPSPEVVATAAVMIATSFATTGVMAFIGFCIADCHAYFRRQGSAPRKVATPQHWLTEEK